MRCGGRVGRARRTGGAATGRRTAMTSRATAGRLAARAEAAVGRVEAVDGPSREGRPARAPRVARGPRSPLLASVPSNRPTRRRGHRAGRRRPGAAVPCRRERQRASRQPGVRRRTGPRATTVAWPAASRRDARGAAVRDRAAPWRSSGDALLQGGAPEASRVTRTVAWGCNEVRPAARSATPHGAAAAGREPPLGCRAPTPRSPRPIRRRISGESPAEATAEGEVVPGWGWGDSDGFAESDGLAESDEAGRAV
jgi:hypothetical protein